MQMGRNLTEFNRDNHVFGKSRVVLFLWFLIVRPFFTNIFIPIKLRPIILRFFGAKIGRNNKIKAKVQIHFPWKLQMGDNCWIGEGVTFINHDYIKLGSNVCISQRSIICSSAHDYRSKSLEYAHKPIDIKDGAWICLDAKVLPGVTIGECSVVSAGEIVMKSLPNYSILIAGKVRAIDPPK